MHLNFLKWYKTSLCDLWSWNDSLLSIMENRIFWKLRWYLAWGMDLIQNIGFFCISLYFPESFLEISSSERDIFVEISVYAFWNGVEHHCATSDHEMTVSFWSWKIWYFVIFRDNLLISTVDSRIQSDPMDFFLIRQTALSPRVFGVWRTSGAWDVSRYALGYH